MSHTIDEMYSVYDEREVVARKVHSCDACGETIARRHRYVRAGIVFNGSAESVKRCLRCQAVHVHLRRKGSREGMWPNERLACGLTYEGEWGPLPDEIAVLAFTSGADMQESQ